MYILLVYNTLRVRTMESNLLPYFIVIEAVIKVNDTPEIHVDDPSVEVHAIYIQEDGLLIPLQILGYFHSSIPKLQLIMVFRAVIRSSSNCIVQSGICILITFHQTKNQ